jgi:3'(2'), 5'-bisphosphate nucleotidase
MKYLNEQDIAYIENLAMKACQAIMEVYVTDFEVEIKKDQSPLTLADKKSNEIITKGLALRFPDYAILAEESKDDFIRLQNDYCFIVDPLDGTKEFIKRNGEFTVNIALAYRHKAVFGMVAVPVTNEVYIAQKGEGAYYKKDGRMERLRVSNRRSELVMVASRSHPSEELTKVMELNQEKIGGTVNVGSSLKGCMIARGIADIYYRFGLTSEWDTAAMQCIVEEAGAIFKNMDDTDMTYNREDVLNRKGFYILNDPANKLLLPNKAKDGNI